MPFFLRNSQRKKIYRKNGSFWLFQLIKNYAETILLIDKKTISQEAPYAAQQSLSRVKSPKTSIRVKKNQLVVNKCDFYYIKRRICLKINFKQFAQIFGDLTLLKLC